MILEVNDQMDVHDVFQSLERKEYGEKEEWRYQRFVRREFK
jgi:hypothetical protein